MRQVPHYLIIGNGRVAKHFQYYFSLLHISFSCWDRSLSSVLLEEKIKHSTHVLLLISDNAIESFIQKYFSQHSNLILIHFSGSLITDKAYGSHPLMTFNKNVYDLNLYQSIPFIVDHDALSFSELFPGLNNPFVYLEKSLKPKYHALCVLSGNFSCLLWQKFFNTLENEFNIPSNMAHLYLQQQTNNLLSHAESALTGPLMRRDVNTIQNNIASLKNDEFQSVYKSFVECYKKISGDENEYF